MKGINKVQLIGYIGGDPDTRSSANGNSTASFSVATTEKWKDKQSGEMQERTDWHRISCFSSLADIATKYLRKGDPVYIEGRIHYSTYTDKDGIERQGTQIIANELSMLGTRGKGGGSAQPAREPTAQAAAAPRAAAPRPAAIAAAPATPIDEDDDIPF